MTRKLLYDDAVYEEILARIDGLTADSRPVWGTMSSAQMMAHLADVQAVGNGRPLEGTPWFVRLFAPLIRKMVINDKPYPRNTRTHPQYVQASEKDFEAEKARLIAELEKSRLTPAGAATRHPLFGELTYEESGWTYYKHLDHHLTQFGA